MFKKLNFVTYFLCSLILFSNIPSMRKKNFVFKKSLSYQKHLEQHQLTKRGDGELSLAKMKEINFESIETYVEKKKCWFSAFPSIFSMFSKTLLIVSLQLGIVSGIAMSSNIHGIRCEINYAKDRPTGRPTHRLLRW